MQLCPDEGSQAISRSRRRQNLERVEIAARDADFKMQVRAARISGAARESDDLPRFDPGTAVLANLAQMSIQRFVAVAMVDDDRVPIA